MVLISSCPGCRTCSRTPWPAGWTPAATLARPSESWAGGRRRGSGWQSCFSGAVVGRAWNEFLMFDGNLQQWEKSHLKKRSLPEYLNRLVSQLISHSVSQPKTFFPWACSTLAICRSGNHALFTFMQFARWVNFFRSILSRTLHDW